MTGNIPSLNGIRALSFLLVFSGHVHALDIVPGGFGVTVFFFLSGYLITTLLRTEYARSGAINFRHFYLRRMFRIWPPFYIVLAAAMVITISLYPHDTLSFPQLAALALQFNNYWIIYHGEGGTPLGTSVYWSLAVEEHFYLVFPLFYLMMQKKQLTPRWQAMIVWAICLLILLWRCILVREYNVPINRTYLATDTRIDSILFGCALAIWQNPMLDQPICSDRCWKYCLFPGALLTILLCFGVRDPTFRETLRYSLQGVALSGVFIAAIRLANWGPFRLLNWRPLEFLGLLSYSAYLMHVIVIATVSRELPGSTSIVQGIGSLVVLLILAWAMLVLVERPCARLRMRLRD